MSDCTAPRVALRPPTPRQRVDVPEPSRHIQNGRLRVAWVAPYDLRRFAHLLDRPREAPYHNAPWITNGALALAQSGVDLHIVTYDKRLTADRRFVEDGITFHLLRIPAPAIPRVAVGYQLDVGSFLRTLDAIQPDIVHGHGTENIFSYAAVRSRYPHVISMQAVVAELVRTYTSWSRARCEHSLVRFVERYTLRRARWAFVEAPFVESLIRRVNPAMSVRLAGNIVSAPFFAVERDRASVAPRIMFVGRLTPTKGVEEIVRAFHTIAASDPRLELHLVGQGVPAYVSGRLRTLIDAGPGSARVVMRGHLSAADIAADYTDARMVVLPTYYDTSPNVIAEAMVAGVPVIATAVGGLPYMLDDGANGQLVPPGDVGGLADAIRSNLRAPEAAEARAVRAQAVARRRYGRELFVSRMLSMYRAVTANPLGGPAGLSVDDERDV
jgi:glycosyltransferase involved in cell wall biosynthesis